MRIIPTVLVFLTLIVAAVSSHSIKHIVVVMEENRSFDHLFGWAGEFLGINGLTGNESNPISSFNESSPRVYVTKNAPYVAACDPQHLLLLTTPKIFGVKNTLAGNITPATATMQGFVEVEHDIHGASNCQVMEMFTPETMPFLTSLAKEYAIMDRFFASVPGPTWPNRQFAMAASSGGSTETFNWFRGEVGALFPQKTFFDQVTEAGGTWRNYYVDTPWELFMQTLADHPENIQTIDHFYAAAASGNLPTYSFINPRAAINVTTREGSNDFHPDHDSRLAEAFVSDIYDAMRKSPSWNDTLLIVTFDEHGGFYDHVSPPMVGIPVPDNYTAQPDYGFVFDRLGIRIPTILISPWIKSGTVISAPPESAKPTPTSEFELTSIMATARKILPGFEATPPLTKRDAWAATFEFVLEELQQPRTTVSQSLLDAQAKLKRRLTEEEATVEATQPVNGLQTFIAQSIGLLIGQTHDVTDAHLGQHTQGSVAKYIDDLHQHHRRAKKSHETQREDFAVWVTPILEWYWILEFGQISFDVNRGNSSSNGTLGTLVTITSRRVNASAGVQYCMDSRATDNETMRSLGVTPCLGGSNPDLNRDPAQQWIWGHDATLRPASRPDLCVTTNIWQGQKAAIAETCQDTVQQHFAYQGEAPGNSNDGRIMYGDGIYNLGWVPTWFVEEAKEKIAQGTRRQQKEL